MTFLDLPDWSREAVSSQRFLGTVTLPGVGTTAKSFTIVPSDRSLILIPSAGAGQALSALVVGHTSNVITAFPQWGANNAILAAAPVSVMVAPAVDLVWDLTWTVSGAAGATTLYVFASSDPAPFVNAAIPQPIMLSDGTGIVQGQSPSAKSLPVVIASDQIAYSVNVVKGGQASALNSFPVVLAADQSTYRMRYDSMQVHTPPTGILATVTLPATANKRWVVDHATWVLRAATATAAGQFGQILDGVTLIYGPMLSVQAVASLADRHSVGPGAGYAGSLGAAVTVTFNGAPPAGVQEAVSVGAYLLPTGL